MRPSLDPARHDPEADGAAEASRAAAGGRWMLVGLVIVGVAFAYLTDSPNPAPASAKNAGWSNWDDAAAQRTRDGGKPTLVLFTANWCPGCRSFESKVLARPDVRSRLERGYTLLMVDLSDRNSPNQAVAAQHNVQVLPTLILYKHDREVARCYGLAANELVAWLRSDGQAVRQFIVD